MPTVNWRTGLWRLAAVLWACGAVFAFLGAVRYLHFEERGYLHLELSPFDRVDPVYRAPLSFDEFLALRNSGKFDEEANPAHEEELVPAALTLRYWVAWLIVLLSVLAWTAALWGIFYTGLWVVKGFRGGEKGRSG